MQKPKNADPEQRFLKWKSNIILKSLGSVRLAVVTMLVLGGVVAWGTLLESSYNADYAKMVVYQAGWFLALLGVLFVNIFVATIMRWPFQKRHTGFVITHIGLLTLLVGSMVTALYGIDGSMRVVEGSSGNQVVLPEYVIELVAEGSRSPTIVDLPRVASAKSESSLKSVNELLSPNLKIKKFEPFVESSSALKSDPTASTEVAIKFGIKSPFFDVSETLFSKSKPFIQMGPAIFRLVLEEEKDVVSFATKAAKTAPKAKAPPPKRDMAAASGKRRLKISDAKSGEGLAEIGLESFLKKGLTFRGMTFTAGKQFQRASVGGGGVEEKGEGKPNPALEVKIQKGDVTMREILFERFPQFSLHNEGIEGIRLSLESPLAELEAKNLIPDDEEHSGAAFSSMGSASGEMPNDDVHSGKMAAGGGAKNEVIFRPDASGGLHVKLKKDGKTVLEKLLAKSETVETPWMGMKLTAQEILRNAVEEADVRAVTPTPRQDLPPSAVLVELENGFPQLPFYLVEGEAKDVRIRDRNYTVYFGRKVIELPFNISLKKFSKVDYPGTQTAMSFESDVEVNDNGKPIKISMNEPLKEDKYTLYQASYQIGNGQPTASIFSVNHDPGRSAKYIGSLIAALGIIIYTVMKSRLARTAKVDK